MITFFNFIIIEILIKITLEFYKDNINIIIIYF